MSDLFDMDGRVVLVTGGTKGIGRAVAELALQHGAKVALSSRSAQDCADVAADLNARFGEGRDVARGISSDLNDVNSLQALVDGVLSQWGRIDALVANAAVMSMFGPSTATPPKLFEKVLLTNIHNNFRLAHMVIPQMQERKDGSLVFITSNAGLVPSPELMVYGVAKAGLAHMARSLALEFAPFNIRINSVSPGFTRSAASRPIWENPEALAATTAGIPLGRIGEAEEVAAMVLLLIAPAGAYITGTTIAVDGGSSSLPSRGAGGRMQQDVYRMRPTR